MEEPSDGQCLSAYRRGDAAAFERLVDRHQGVLLRHASALIGDRGAAEDAVQEVFLKLAQSPPEISAGADESERAQLLGWLHKVLRNACLDRLRAESRRREREHEMAREERIDGAASSVEAADTRAAVQRGLTRLNPDQREVLVLRLLEGRSYREIAEATGRKVGTVGWLVSTGLRALAAELEPLLGGEPARRGEREAEAVVVRASGATREATA